jgi:hypothetical protein
MKFIFSQKKLQITQVWLILLLSFIVLSPTAVFAISQSTSPKTDGTSLQTADEPVAPAPGCKGVCRPVCDSVEEQEDPWFSDACAETSSIAPKCCVGRTEIGQSGSADQTVAGTGVQGAKGGSGPGSAMTIFDPLKNITLVGVLNQIIKAFLGIIGAIALLVFVYAGVIYMTAENSDRVKQAISAMKYAAFGMGIIIFAYIITNTFIMILTQDPSSQKTSQVITTP